MNSTTSVVNSASCIEMQSNLYDSSETTQTCFHWKICAIIFVSRIQIYKVFAFKGNFN